MNYTTNYTHSQKHRSLYDFMAKTEQLTLIRTVREGLLNITPVLIIGAFSLILKTFPVSAYQSFLDNFAQGLLRLLLDFIYSATFGVLSIYMTISISRSYTRIKAKTSLSSIGTILASLMSFFILAGAYLDGFGTDSLGPKSMFLAIITGIGASNIYITLYDKIPFGKRRFYSTGADREFNQMLSYLAPLALTVLVFALFNLIIVTVFKTDSFKMLLSSASDKLFSFGKTGFLKGFFFVLLSSLLWFCGIHGSDTLEGVMQIYFTPNLAVNQAAITSGGAPTEILTKEFFDCFVLMGGCGSAICLLIAILIFSRSSARRGLGFAAALPMIFNINELMVFGLPIIFNPIMLIPFVVVPLVSFSVSYIALSAGFVPLITSEVAWTTPIILGGYCATGSFSGSMLQIVNVIIGVLIYLPFVKLYDKRDEEKYRSEYESFAEYFRQNEQELSQLRLIEQKNVYGEFAKALCAELRRDIKNSVVLAYQPQYNYAGKCIGAEALLRMDHPVYGMLYPPLVVKLAKEGEFLAELEEAVFICALNDREKLLETFGSDIKLSVNVSGNTIVTPRFLQFCQRLSSKDSFSSKNICLEVTEQDTLTFDSKTISAFKSLHSLGLSLAIDDFSMGQTSLNYLKENLFDIIKLDGSLVKGLFSNKNCKEIVLSITSLAKSLNLSVIAEFVETEEQKEALHEIGCDIYQGYLYSPAVFLDKRQQQKNRV